MVNQILEWISTVPEAETPILWPPDAKNWLIGTDPDAGKDWRQEEKGTTEDEMVGWHHRLDGHEFEQAPGVGDGQEGLVCCSPWGSQRVGHDRDWTELNSRAKSSWAKSWGQELRKSSSSHWHQRDWISTVFCLESFYLRFRFQGKK